MCGFLPSRWIAQPRNRKVYYVSHIGIRVGELVDLRLSDVEIGERSGRVKITGKGRKNTSTNYIYHQAASSLSRNYHRR